MKVLTTLSLLLILTVQSRAQESNISNFDQEYLNWFNLDLEKDNVLGTSVDRAYEILLKDMKPKKTVVVAVLDSGVDILHEDFTGHIWVNEDEIPNNNIDDDKNGYVDDVNGWSYLGNRDGENIRYENLETTRIVRRGDKSDPNYQLAKELYDAELNKQEATKAKYDRFENIYNEAKEIILEGTGIDVTGLADLVKVESTDYKVGKAKDFLKKRYALGFTEEKFASSQNRNNEKLDYYLNQNYLPRLIVGDDPLDLEDRNYGNNDVTGPGAMHGTSVAGVIAGVRDNGIGINGIATDVVIMSVRTIPQGDERDKDVALGIRYAVDNGADIINMSFGKMFSPEKKFVDDAVKYAEKHGVLMIHAAGNDGDNIDIKENYPSDRYLDKTEPTNWLNVGAASKNMSKEIPAIFSNYGEQHVDIFAPGVDMISLDTGNTYHQSNGTSIAAPVVSGIAALVLAYYPDLTPPELIDIILESSYKVLKPKKVYRPGFSGKKRKKVRFYQLSKSGGVANGYAALLLAKEHSKKSTSKSNSVK